MALLAVGCSKTIIGSIILKLRRRWQFGTSFLPKLLLFIFSIINEKKRRNALYSAHPLLPTRRWWICSVQTWMEALLQLTQACTENRKWLLELNYFAIFIFRFAGMGNLIKVLTRDIDHNAAHFFLDFESKSLSPSQLVHLKWYEEGCLYLLQWRLGDSVANLQIEKGLHVVCFFAFVFVFLLWFLLFVVVFFSQ